MKNIQFYDDVDTGMDSAPVSFTEIDTEDSDYLPVGTIPDEVWDRYQKAVAELEEAAKPLYEYFGASSYAPLQIFPGVP